MMEVEYYDTASKSGANEFAKALANAAGMSVRLENNKMIMPPELFTGRMEFYELNDGLAIGFVDGTIHVDVRVNQGAVTGSENYRILINIADTPWKMTNNDGAVVYCGTSLANAVLFVSNSMRSTVEFEKGQRQKAILIHFHRNWLVRYMLQNRMPLQIARLKQFANHESMQFSSILDLKSFRFAEEMLQIKAPERLIVRILEGYACQLTALFFNNQAEDHAAEERFISDDAMRILQLKEQIEKKIEEPLMAMEKAAEQCLMSRTKFMGIFKTMFQKNYGIFFQELKMEKAKELLNKGLSVSDVGYDVGYVNISHFIKAFHRQYGVTPGVYQQKNKASQTDEM